MILTTVDEHFRACIKHALLADEIIIATFGIYAGLTQKSSRLIPCLPAELLDICNEKSATIWLGTKSIPECIPECIHCKEKDYALQQRTVMHKKHWPSINWIEKTESHAKGFCFRSRDEYTAIIGGRNLSTSSWTDFSFLIEGKDARETFKAFQELVRRA